jgi:hypothetical protein
MPARHSETRNIVFHNRALPVGSCPHEESTTEGGKDMSRTIKTIGHHMIPRSTIPPVRLGLQNRERKLVAEWQRGVEILGHAQRKLRLAFAPTQSPAFATLSLRDRGFADLAPAARHAASVPRARRSPFPPQQQSSTNASVPRLRTSMPVSYAEARNIVFLKSAVRGR